MGGLRLDPADDEACGPVLRIYRLESCEGLPWVLQVPANPNLTFAAAAPWPLERPVRCSELRSLPFSCTLEEEIPLITCRRAGPLVALIAARNCKRRSQIHLMEDGSGTAWWNTPQTTQSLRPGIRVPTRRPPGDGAIQIQVDSRERLPYSFAGRPVTAVRVRLDAGDYAIATAVGLPAVERKSLEDFAQSAVKGTLSYVMDELSTLPRAAVVVEGGYGDLLSFQYVGPDFLANLMAILSVRYPAVPIFFADTRALGEDWTYRWLAAARAELGRGRGSSASAADAAAMSDSSRLAALSVRTGVV
jgi:hypothetical protein